MKIVSGMTFNMGSRPAPPPAHHGQHKPQGQQRQWRQAQLDRQQSTDRQQQLDCSGLINQNTNFGGMIRQKEMKYVTG